jgi:hypothetical protein
VKITVTIDDRQLRDLEGMMPKKIDRGISTIAHAHEAKAVERAPRESGSLASSIHVRKNAPADYSSATNATSEDGAPYDVFQEFGTGMKSEDWGGRPLSTRHLIFPREKKALSWSVGGRRVFAKFTTGVPAVHYMEGALDDIEPFIPALFRQGFESIK